MTNGLTGRWVIVVNDDFAIPFTTKEAAQAYMKLMLTMNLSKANVGKDDPSVFIDEEQAYQSSVDPTIFMSLAAEGADGVFAGFDGADRCSYAAPVGVAPEDFAGWGDGDPIVFPTVGTPPMGKVNGVATPDTAQIDAKFGY